MENTTTIEPVEINCEKVKSFINELCRLENMDEFYDIYMHVQNKYREHEKIKKFIIKKSVKKHHEARYTCDICNKEFKQNYKYLHDKSKEHIKKVGMLNKSTDPIVPDNNVDVQTDVIIPDSKLSSSSE